MSGLFSTFNVAMRGMTVQQKAIDVTSHNVANANTEGYSRQRVKIETTTPFGMPSINNKAEAGQLGTGAQVSAVERYRDSFLDYQTRTEMSTNGQYDAKNNVLSNVESIFNEPSDTGLSTLVGKFFDAFQQLSKQPQSSNARTVVAQQSAALADDLNHTYTQLTNLKDNVKGQVKGSILQVNDILKQIDGLNQQIIGVSISGNHPNDLMDKRDLLLDQLSSKFNFNVEKTQYNGINLRPVDNNGVSTTYMIEAQKGQDIKSLSYVSSVRLSTDAADPAGTYVITYYKKGDTASELNKGTIKLSGSDVNTPEIVKSIQSSGVLWANSDGIAVSKDGTAIKDGETIEANTLATFLPSDGAFKGFDSVQKDIDSYIGQINGLAKALAFAVNAVHSGQSTSQADGMPFFVNSSVAHYNTDGTINNIDLVRSGEQDITAENISVNKEILSDVMKIKTRTHDDQFSTEAANNIDGETDGARAQAIAQIRDSIIRMQDLGVSVNSRADMFGRGGNKLNNNGMEIAAAPNGMNLNSYFKDTIDKLGVQAQEASRMVKNQETLLASFQESRSSFSGVSLDEEMANLVQYQHAYQANAKVIATVDSLLDVVINGLMK